MGEAAVTFLLEQVKQVVIGYVELISGAEGEFEQLQRELVQLKDYLKQTVKKRKKDALLRGLERETRDTVYEVEDTIDSCLTRASASLRRTIGIRNAALAREIKSMREKKVVPLLAKFHALPVESGDPEEPHETKGETPIRQNKVVGFDEEEATISGYLKEKTEKLDVISIEGIPGQGKTTLAWKIYQRNDIGYHFPIRIWVSISQVFDSKDVFLEILRKFFPSEDTSSLKALNFMDLVQTVRTCLEKERFLLVLDDVWSVDAWNDIKEVLPVDNGEGKVVITTRETVVGEKSRVYRAPHKLKFLDDSESWELLQYEVFGNLEDCPPELGGIGYLIAKKCDGVPLTIVVIGGILFDQLAKSQTMATAEWKMVSENISDALQDDKTQRIKEVVEMSYQRLPDHLRECFVYLSVFPEDYEIPAKMLCGLWIAEEFVLPKNGRSLEETAEANMNDLICRNLLKVEKTNHMGRVKTCRVHDMIRAFCIKISKDENLCREIKVSKTGALESPVSEARDSHRLCLRSDLSKFLQENPSGQHVRSFLCFYERPVELEPQYYSVIPDGFPKLRILESRCIKFNNFPAKITKLLHLRYLTLHVENLDTLPKQITSLWNLESIVVETKSRFITMKANMWKMMRLRCLKSRAAIVLSNEWKGEAGQNLRTLNRLAPESWTEAVSVKARSLETLGISGKVAVVFKKGFLENLRHLVKLKLVNSVAYEQTSEDKLASLPSHSSFPPHLKRLTLSNTFLDWQHMSTLAMIKSLEALKLKDNAFVGLSWYLGGDTFPSLQLLLVFNTDLVLWEASTGSFPKLKVLVVKNCENLKEIPECLGTHLEKLEIDRVRSSAVQSAEKIKASKGKHFSLIIGPIHYMVVDFPKESSRDGQENDTFSLVLGKLAMISCSIFAIT